MKKYDIIVWDFNGTVLDDVRLGIDCVNTMLAKRNLPTLPDETAYRRVFGFPIEEYYQRLGFDFAKEDYHTVLAPEWVEMYLENYRSSPLTEHAVQTLQTLGEMGYVQILLSATELQMLKNQLKGLGLEQYFEEVCGLDNIHAGSKLDAAVAWRAQHPDAVALFVGDTVHDFDVASAVGADCVLYSQGHQSREQLSSCGCRMIDDLSELIDLLSAQ